MKKGVWHTPVLVFLCNSCRPSEGNLSPLEYAGIRSLYLRDTSEIIIIPVEGSVANLYETRISVVVLPTRSLFNEERGGGGGGRTSATVFGFPQRLFAAMNVDEVG